MNPRNVVLLILERDDGRILLQHRTDDAPVWPGFWGLFGGGIEKGETPSEALEREISEELNYTLTDYKVFYQMKVSSSDYSGKRHIFISHYDNNQILTQHEGKGMGWFTVDEALDLKLNDYNRIVMDMYREAHQPQSQTHP